LQCKCSKISWAARSAAGERRGGRRGRGKRESRRAEEITYPEMYITYKCSVAFNLSELSRFLQLSHSFSAWMHFVSCLAVQYSYADHKHDELYGLLYKLVPLTGIYEEKIL